MGTCGEVDADSLELYPMVGGEFSANFTSESHQANALEEILNYRRRQDVHLRIVNENQVEMVYVRDGQIVVETYQVRATSEVVRSY